LNLQNNFFDTVKDESGLFSRSPGLLWARP
jgi:hypothetical protein